MNAKRLLNNSRNVFFSLFSFCPVVATSKSFLQTSVSTYIVHVHNIEPIASFAIIDVDAYQRKIFLHELPVNKVCFFCVWLKEQKSDCKINFQNCNLYCVAKFEMFPWEMLKISNAILSPLYTIIFIYISTFKLI